MEQIRKSFDQIFKINDEDWQIFSSKFIRQEFPKKCMLLKEMEIENNLSFMEKGTVRLYIPKAENDITFGFIFENEFISAYDSFLTRQPSAYCIETLQHTVLWRISYDDLQAVYEKTTVANLIGRKAAEDLFLKKSKRELSLLNDTAEVRYLKIFTERPYLLQHIPLKYIASYIGVTPQALSRIRKRIS